MTTQATAPPIMNPNYVPPHLRAGFDPTDIKWASYTPPLPMLNDGAGNKVPGNPYYEEEMAFWEAHRAGGSATTDISDIADAGDITTAGTSKIPTMVWYVAGAIALYYIGKKQKWF